MTTGQKRDWEGPSRRRVPRYDLQAPVDVTVVRAGMPNTLPGRSTNLGERGIAAVIAGELVPGETVDIELKLSSTTEPLSLHAVVRYQDELRCGLEFVELTVEQKARIREWARDPNLEARSSAPVPPSTEKSKVESPPRPAKSRQKTWLIIAMALLLLIAGAIVFSRKWNESWRQLESGLPGSSTAIEKPSVRLPAEEMQKRLIHRVEPSYPAEARAEDLQGIIALDIVVGGDGSVHHVRALNGPDVLAKAAMDALRWWRFEPYRVNGQPVTVESTIAVEFKR